MRHITFPEFCHIMDDASAVILDNNALSYPYVESYEDEDGNMVYDYVAINYIDEHDYIEHSFYSDDTTVFINGDGNLELKVGDELYIVTVLEFKKLS